MNAIIKQNEKTHKKIVKILIINHNQILKEVKTKETEIVKLKGRRLFKLDKWLDDEIAAEKKDRKC